MPVDPAPHARSETLEAVETNEVDVEINHNFAISKLAFNLTLIAISYPRFLYDAIKFVRVRAFTISDDERLHKVQKPPLKRLALVEEQLDGIPIEQHGLLVGLVPKDSHRIDIRKLRKAGRPGRRSGDVLANATVEDYCESYTALEYNDYVARAIARFRSPRHLETRRMTISYEVLVNPDLSRVYAGDSIQAGRICFFEQFRDDSATITTTPRMRDAKIHDILSRHYRQVLNTAGSSQLSGGVTTTITLERSVRLASSINTAPSAVHDMNAHSITNWTSALPRTSGEERNQDTEVLQKSQSPSDFMMGCFEALKTAITQHDASAWAKYEESVLRQFFYHNSANLSADTAWTLFCSMMTRNLDDLQEIHTVLNYVKVSGQLQKQGPVS
ncbi:hypothetical protein K461DRAFT_298360 [Myriangium duriaei CBS 260.36]|uniref:Uncharacterized protein n=1 Tax=Myriangium duriaei CBS 260.36 TaxID=1168546 RepID=A0A9P4MFB2_9PEZI|nr:hypothetical protein K461DRAFT_298360 [Myriangium duriaei CBS 260.36]